MLKMIASFYDHLGLMSPILVEGKHPYRLAVDEKRGWDNEVSTELKEKWVAECQGSKINCTIFRRHNNNSVTSFDGCQF